MSTMSYNRYYAPHTQVEPDQRDLVIQQLKAELFELRRNDKDYSELQAQLKNMEHRYQLLQDDKTISEAEYRNRNEQNFKQIANLKTEIDNARNAISDGNIEYQELRAESTAIKEIAEHRSIEVTKLKNELQDAIAQHSTFSEEIKHAETQVNLARDDKHKLLGELDQACAFVEDINFKNNELEKLLKELEVEKSRLIKSGDILNHDLEQANHDLRVRDEDLEVAEGQVGESQKQIIGLENELRDYEQLNDKQRTELQIEQRSKQDEQDKNYELNARLTTLENNLTSRENQIDDLRQEFESLKHAHSNLLDGNFTLNQDLDNIRRTIDLLNRSNQELVTEMEMFNETDEKVRQLLNRKHRVSELKNKSEINLRQSYNVLKDANNSPAKRRFTHHQISPYK